MRHRLHGFVAILLAAFVFGCGPTEDDDNEWRIQTLVSGSLLHSPNGITFGPDGKLYAGSVGAQTIYRIDVDTGHIEVVVAAPAGEADDVAFAPDGTLVWTALISGEIRALRADGTVDAVVEDFALINPVRFTSDGRLFAAQIGFDRLYEFPFTPGPSHLAEPRLVAAKIGNLNSFEFSADDRLFGPLFNIGTVAWIDIESGEVTPIATGLGRIVAVSLDDHGGVWTVDWASGKLWHIEPAGDGWRDAELVTTLEPPLDNLTVGPDGAIYASRPAHSSIVRFDPATGEQKTIVSGSLAAPGGLAIMTRDGREALLVADGYGYRVVDTQSGAVTATIDLTEFGFPGASTAAAANDDYFLLADASTRPRVYLVDRSSGETVTSWTGIEAPMGVALTDGGQPIVADFDSGALIGLSRADRKQRTIIADDLDGPVGVAWAGTGAVFVSEAMAGTVLRIELVDGKRTLIAGGLNQPEGLTVMSDGRIAIIEVGERRLVAFDPAAGTLDVLATDLPVGEPAGNAPPPVFRPSGVAQGSDGSLYVSGDRDNSILKIIAVP